MAGRDWVAAEVSIRLATQLADAEITPADSAGNLKEPIDDAMRMLGVDESDLTTVDFDDAVCLLAATRYTVLRMVLERISDRFNISTPRGRFDLATTVSNVKQLLEFAAVDVDMCGVSDDTVIDLNFKRSGYVAETFG
jgi:hypothetical protein